MNMNKFERRERRNKIEIYCSILNSIEEESESGMIVRPTRVQFLSNLSYDVLMKYIKELKEKKMIRNSEALSITEKGERFLKDCEKIQKLVERMGLNYL
jgi:predicted transcriptional regulator